MNILRTSSHPLDSGLNIALFVQDVRSQLGVVGPLAVLNSKLLFKGFLVFWFQCRKLGLMAQDETEAVEALASSWRALIVLVPAFRLRWFPLAIAALAGLLATVNVVCACGHLPPNLYS